VGRSDLLTRAAAALVLLVGLLAVADSVRGCDTIRTEVRPAPATTEATTSTTTAEDGPVPQTEAPLDWPQGALDGVLTFVSADDCRIRTIGLAGGRERPATRFVTDCRGFWAPRVGSRLAFGEVLGDGFFRIADLGHPRRDFGAYPIGPQTLPLWSPDGQRVAWCDSPSTGIEREILGRGRILPFCPVAYTPSGRLAHVEDQRVVVGSRTVVRTTGQIDFAQFAADGSVVLVLDGVRIERYARGKPVISVQLPPAWTGEPPSASPSGCLAAVTTADGITVLPLGCEQTEALTFRGRAAAWSPSGDGLAVAEEGQIVFRRLDEDGGAPISWPASAVQLAWRSG
jgi:hypothetical protein